MQLFANRQTSADFKSIDFALKAIAEPRQPLPEAEDEPES
jgi:hypothetical protein